MESYLIDLANLAKKARGKEHNITIMIHHVRESDVPAGWYKSPEGQLPVTYQSTPTVWGVTAFIND